MNSKKTIFVVLLALVAGFSLLFWFQRPAHSTAPVAPKGNAKAQTQSVGQAAAGQPEVRRSEIAPPVAGSNGESPGKVSAIPAAPVSSSTVFQAPAGGAVVVGFSAENKEQMATRKMYLAHAPLREREVADPDSEGNRRVLQTMVLKGIEPQATKR